MERFLDQYGYIALLIGTFVEGETAILISSSLIPRGWFTPPFTIFFGFLGSFISDWVYFFIGRAKGDKFLKRFPRIAAKVEPARKFFEKHQVQVLFSYRFLYGLRMIIPLIVGMSKLRLSKYLFYATVSGLIWASVVTGVGFLIGTALDVNSDIFKRHMILFVVGFACIGMGTGYILKKFLSKRLATA